MNIEKLPLFISIIASLISCGMIVPEKKNKDNSVIMLGLLIASAGGNKTAAISTLAGSTTGISGSTDGQGSAALFNGPEAVAVDNAGNIYVGDSLNHTIRKITASGLVTTIGGIAGTAGVANGATGTTSTFNKPEAIAIDLAGRNLYVCDTGAGTSANVRKISISASGIVTSVTDFATGFNGPEGLAVDSAGNVYIGDSGNNVIKKTTSAGGTPGIIAGTSGTSGATDSPALFNSPRGPSVDSSGNIFVADNKNNVIRKITAQGTVTTFAGSLFQTAGSADGTGNLASFNGPYGVVTDSSGNIYVSDATNNTIRKITSSGVVTTLAGAAGIKGSTDGSGTSARFNSNRGIAIDSSGNLYIADKGNNAIRKITFQ